MTEWTGQGSDDVIPQWDDSTSLWVLTCVSWTQELGKFGGDFRKKWVLYVLLGRSLEVRMQFWMPSVHNPPTRFTVTYVYVHCTDMKPFEICSIAKNRLEILCTIVDYSLPLFTFRNYTMIHGNRNSEVQSDTPLVSCRSEVRLSFSLLRL